MRRPPARPLLLLAAAALAAGTSGCHRHRHGGAAAVTTRLDCPEEQGDLHRTAVAADGRSCRYAGADGQEVTLAYLALDGRSPQEALRSTEAALRADVPAAAANEPGSLRPTSENRDAAADDDEDADGRREGASAPATPAVPAVPAAPRAPEPPQVDRGWTAAGRAGGGHDRVHINLPFLHVDADGTGRAHVRTFGVSVDADGDGASVVRTPGGGDIRSGDGGAEMRFGAVGRRRADLVYMVASDHPGPGGFRSGAYVAKGPASGPLVLAVVRSRREGDNRGDGDLRDVKRLVNANVRGDRGADIDVDAG